VWIRRLLFFSTTWESKKYQNIVIVEIRIQENIHFFEFFPLNKGNQGDVADIIQ